MISLGGKTNKYKGENSAQSLLCDLNPSTSLPKSCLDIPSGAGFAALSSVILSLTPSEEGPKKTFGFPDLGSSCGMGNTFAEGRAAEHGVEVSGEPGFTDLEPASLPWFI